MQESIIKPSFYIIKIEKKCLKLIPKYINLLFNIFLILTYIYIPGVFFFYFIRNTMVLYHGVKFSFVDRFFPFNFNQKCKCKRCLDLKIVSNLLIRSCRKYYEKIEKINYKFQLHIKINFQRNENFTMVFPIGIPKKDTWYILYMQIECSEQI